LTYPQNGIIPTVNFIDARDRDVPFLEKTKYAKRGLVSEITQRYAELEPAKRDLISRQRQKRDLRLRANGTLDPWVSATLEFLLAVSDFFFFSTDAHFSQNLSITP
jgi:hypothetical protein